MVHEAAGKHIETKPQQEVNTKRYRTDGALYLAVFSKFLLRQAQLFSPSPRLRAMETLRLTECA